MENTVRNLKAQTISGIKWQVGISLFQKGISLITTIIVARHLGPSVYGLFGLAMIIVASFELFKSMGIDSALVRRKDDFEAAADTAFIIIPLLGFFLYFLLYLLAPTIGMMLKNAEIIKIVRILGIVFVFTCFTKVPTVHLERDMQFMKISIAEFISQISFASVAIVAALKGYEVWALVFAYIARVVTHMGLIWFYAGWKPRFRFDVSLALEMFNFGKFIFLSVVIFFLKMNLDNFLVGKLLGTTMLGFYAVSFNLSNFGSDYLGKQISRVTFCAYSKIWNEKENLQKAFLQSLKYISVIALPLSIIIFVLGDGLISVLFGKQWLGASPVLRIIVWAGLFNFLTVPCESFFLSIGKSKLYFWIVFIQVALFFIFIAPAAKYSGLIGVGIVVTIASLISLILSLFSAKKHSALKIREMYWSIKPSVLSSLILFIFAMFLENNFAHFFVVKSQIAALLIKFNVLFFFYGIVLFFIDKNLFKDIGRMIFKKG